MPPTWVKDIPGIYEGVLGSYREVVIFSTNGDYQHEVFRGQEQVTKEFGKWAATPGMYEIFLTPKSDFTQYYDPMKRAPSEKGASYGHYYYRPLSEGDTFTKISASVNYEFTLARKK